MSSLDVVGTLAVVFSIVGVVVHRRRPCCVIIGVYLSPPRAQTIFRMAVSWLEPRLSHTFRFGERFRVLMATPSDLNFLLRGGVGGSPSEGGTPSTPGGGNTPRGSAAKRQRLRHSDMAPYKGLGLSWI